MPHGVSNTLDYMHVMLSYYIGTGALYHAPQIREEKLYLAFHLNRMPTRNLKIDLTLKFFFLFGNLHGRVVRCSLCPCKFTGEQVVIIMDKKWGGQKSQDRFWPVTSIGAL